MATSTGGENSPTRRAISSSNVAAGSVWESRMKIHQFRGGVKFFHGGSDNLESDDKAEEIRDTERTVRSAVKRRAQKTSGDQKSSVRFQRKDHRSEEIAVEKKISDCECNKQIIVVQTSQLNSNSELSSKPNSCSTVAIAEARSDNGTEFSPLKKLPSSVRDSGVNSRVSQTFCGLQSVVDLVMWKHVPRSSLVFGFGTFVIIASSYTKDLNISFISVTSYLGLIYLATMFLYKSFRSRHIADGHEMESCHGLAVIGEEEAIWMLRLILPYVNEFLLNLKALFSGDPVVTMKLAAVLFALARCGSYITIRKMVKLGFFAAFILPKLCSSHSAQVTGYGMFWILRFEDAWNSCSHKKVVCFAIFTIVWNLSSMVARIWAVFMLFTAVRYYQQSTIKTESWDGVGAGGGACNDNRALRRPQVISKVRQGRSSTTSIPSTQVDVY